MATRTRKALRSETRKFLGFDLTDLVDYSLAIAVQGDHTTPSTVTIQTLDLDGKALALQNQIKVRVTNLFGGIQAFTITAAGSGYGSTPPTVTIAAPTTAGGVTATATAVLTTGSVTSFVITNPGSGYTAAPVVTLSGNATATVTVNTTIANATNATIAAGTGTVVLDTITATKELMLLSDATGLFTITCTDTTVESFMLRLAAGFGSVPSNCQPTITVAHA